MFYQDLKSLSSLLFLLLLAFPAFGDPISSATLVQQTQALNPEKQLFVKDAPVLAYRITSDKPDFYIIGKSTFDSKYKSVDYAEVSAKNPKYFGKLSQQVPNLVKTNDRGLLAVLKTTPTEMIKMSDLGYPTGKAATIESPWGEQTKPAGQDAFLVWDDSKKQYYMVNASEQGLPLSYVPQTDTASAVISAEKRAGTIPPECADNILNGI
jgi:hypothetical protein